jgi:hypothetical protein
VIKQQRDRQEYIDDFYASHPNTPRPLSRFGSVVTHGGDVSTPSSSSPFNKRAQSLPDVLCDVETREQFRARTDRGRSDSVRNNQQQQQQQGKGVKGGGAAATSPNMPRY